jgi:hypothetical protein
MKHLEFLPYLFALPIGLTADWTRTSRFSALAASLCCLAEICSNKHKKWSPCKTETHFVDKRDVLCGNVWPVEYGGLQAGAANNGGADPTARGSHQWAIARTQ